MDCRLLITIINLKTFPRSKHYLLKGGVTEGRRRKAEGKREKVGRCESENRNSHFLTCSLSHLLSSLPTFDFRLPTSLWLKGQCQ